MTDDVDNPLGLVTLETLERAEAMSFAGARRRALATALESTPAERLAWLEEAIEIAHASGALPRRPRTR